MVHPLAVADKTITDLATLALMAFVLWLFFRD